MKSALVVPLFPSVTVASLIDIESSSFRMVPTPWPSAMLPLTAPERLTTNVSSGSTAVSPVT